MTNSTQPLPEWLDDWSGLHTLDDGHPGSYDHEAVAGVDGDAATLKCQCGTWTGYAPCAEGDAEDLLDEWRAHVYEATDRERPRDDCAADDKLPVVRPDWVPSHRALVAIRASLHEMNRSAAAMRSVSDSGDPDFDEAWSDLTEAYQDLVDRIRRPLDAEDWPALVAVLIEARADFKALRGREGVVQDKLCDSLAASIEEAEAEIAAPAKDALIGGAA